MKFSKNSFLVRFFLSAVLLGLPLFYLILGIRTLVDYVSTSEGLLTLTIAHPPKFDSRIFNKQLLKGGKVSIKIEAKQDNLGSVGVRFYNFDRINDDVLIFRIKEIGDDDWYYENEYKVDQFQPDEIFPYGFPQIENSEGKIYVFELESLFGEPGNAVGISRFSPRIKSKYQFDFDELKNRPAFWLYFMYKKSLNLLVNGDFMNLILVKVIPLVIYFGLFKLLIDKYEYFQKVFNKLVIRLEKNIGFLLFSWGLLVVDFLVIRDFSDALLIFILLLISLSTYVYRITFFSLSYISLIGFLIYPVLYTLGYETTAEKISIWSYLVLIIGIVRVIIVRSKFGARKKLRL